MYHLSPTLSKLPMGFHVTAKTESTDRRQAELDRTDRALVVKSERFVRPDYEPVVGHLTLWFLSCVSVMCNPGHVKSLESGFNYSPLLHSWRVGTSAGKIRTAGGESLTWRAWTKRGRRRGCSLSSTKRLLWVMETAG